MAGRAGSNWRILIIFVSTLFENLISEEICGRFGSFRWINLFISTPVETRIYVFIDDRCQLHCLNGFCYL